MESIELKAAVRPRARRMAVTVDGTLVIVALAVLSTLVEALLALENSFARARFPYANNAWSEGPLALELHRMATGFPAYLSTLHVNSYDYGPLYVDMLEWWRAMWHHSLDIVWLRDLTMVMGAVAMIPLVGCSLAIARRAGVKPSDRLANWMIIVSTVTAGIAILAQGITFEVIHPDNISYVFMGGAFWITYLLADRRLKPAWLLALIVCSIAAVFAKQSSFILLPLAVLGLALARAISLAWAALALGIYGGILGLIFFLIPRDELNWIFFVPGAHGYELNPWRIADLIRFLTHWDPFLAILLVVFPFAALMIARNEGRRALWVDGAIFAAVLFTSLAGFFKALGVWNNLTVIGIAMVPYFSAVFGVLLTRRLLNAMPRPILVPTLFLMLAVPLGLATPPKQEPDPHIYAMMQNVANVSRDLCRTKATIAVTSFPELFFDCPNARYTLMASWQELYTAYPRYYVGPTDADKPPTASILVALDAQELPPAWASKYKLVRSISAVRGWGANYFPVHFDIYHLKTAQRPAIPAKPPTARNAAAQSHTPTPT